MELDKAPHIRTHYQHSSKTLDTFKRHPSVLRKQLIVKWDHPIFEAQPPDIVVDGQRCARGIMFLGFIRNLFPKWRPQVKQRSSIVTRDDSMRPTLVDSLALIA